MTSAAPTASNLIDFESAVQEVQLRDTCKHQVCISNLAFTEEAPDSLQGLVKAFFQTNMHMGEAVSGVSAVKRLQGKDDRPGTLLRQRVD